MGTGTQLGAVVGVSIEIYDFTTPDDRAMLVQAFEKSQNQGLVSDLTAGEFDLNDQAKSKSTGVLYPLCQLAMDEEGQFQFNQHP